MIEPGAVLGVLGSGQLGRMFAIEARRLGYGVHVLSPRRGTPTGAVADREITAEYADLDAVASFAAGVDVVTYEFEKVPASTAAEAARHAPVRPDPSVLRVGRNRVREKRTLRDAGFPVTPFARVESAEQLRAAADGELGTPGVLKTTTGGYDGKGQVRVESPEQAGAAWSELGVPEGVYERFIDFERELSVIAARGTDGSSEVYGPIHNEHVDHVLDLSRCPAEVSARVAREARAIGREIARELDVVGVLCVELFLTPDATLLVNEIAPRPHNSGHLTIEGHVSSQFEQQVRGVCGLPLGSVEPVGPAAMANLLGDLWRDGDGAPPWNALLRRPDVKLHLYGKRDARPGRKMGHVTALGADVEEAAAKVERARAVLAR